MDEHDDGTHVHDTDLDDHDDDAPVPIYSNVQINVPVGRSIQTVLNQTINNLMNGRGIVSSANVLLVPNATYEGNLIIEHDNITIKTSDDGASGCYANIVGSVTISDQGEKFY
jgi:hypothetical protein